MCGIGDIALKMVYLKIIAIHVGRRAIHAVHRVTTFVVPHTYAYRIQKRNAHLTTYPLLASKTAQSAYCVYGSMNIRTNYLQYIAYTI